MGLLDRWTKKKEAEKLSSSTPKKIKDEVKEVVEKKTKTQPAKDATVKAEKKVKKTEKAVVIETKEEKMEVGEAKPKTARVVGKNDISYKILLKPLITEKSAIAESLNKYSFFVNRNATKTQIIKAVKDVYGVKPIKANVANIEGRTVRFGRSYGRRSDYKKVVVTLPKGKTIAIHEGV
jgi:large subunit ribosomal protein L23